MYEKHFNVTDNQGGALKIPNSEPSALSFFEIT